MRYTWMLDGDVIFPEAELYTMEGDRLIVSNTSDIRENASFTCNSWEEAAEVNRLPSDDSEPYIYSRYSELPTYVFTEGNHGNCTTTFNK